MLRLRVRRFFCDNAGCGARTFVEQVAGLTVKWARRTNVAARVLCAIGLAVAVLRLVRQLPDPAPAVLTRIGVDDFAFRRGHTYGTVIVNIDTHQPIDVLPDRTRDTLVDWLRTHPGVELVCRDRAGAYAEAVRTAAPNATQVADRWHLWHNLLEAVEKTVIAERGALHAPEPDPEPESKEVAARPDSYPGEQPTTPLEGRLAIRTRQRYAAVQRLVAAGRSMSAIGNELGLQRKTVRRFAFADSLDELLTTATTRGSLLDPFKPYLHQRFNAGHTDAARLTREITALGYRGSDKTVRRYLQPFRETLAAPPPAPVPPSVRQVTGWLTCHPDRLTDDDRVQLKQVLARSDMLTITHQQVHDFAELLTQRRGEHLDGWMRDVDARGAAPLRSFTKGLRTDLAAVAAGLTLPYSSGPVEGAITRIKALKRQMYGRAGFSLLRKRILNPA